MRIVKATARYEKWLGKQLTILPHDIRMKHQNMAEGAFPFLRATFYRWMQVWPEVCPEFKHAPTLVAVGDLHVENFGTWRDSEGRLVWGINDFDEASRLPYTLDLVRLAASTIIAHHENHLAISPGVACAAILAGYRAGLKSGGRPFILGEHHHWLRLQAMGAERDPVVFWRKMDALYRWRQEVPKTARKALECLLPDAKLKYNLCTRTAGLGSLGRQRFVAVAEWNGGQIAREAKALAPSACLWAGTPRAKDAVLYAKIMEGAVRCLDPLVRVITPKSGAWIVRRLAPYSSRIELAQLPKQREEAKLLEAMGSETANVHWGTPSEIPAVRKDLSRRRGNWLLAAATRMADSVRADWKDWRKEMA